MFYNKVELCGINTSKLTVLKEKEKNELLKLMKQGGAEGAKAREKMIAGNLRLVLSVVQKFAGRCDNPDDLFQVGCIGLIKAIDNFDLNQNVQFSTYGVPMIIGEIRRFLRDNNAIRVSRSMRDLAYKAMQAKEQLQKTLLHEPTCQDIAKLLCVEEKQVTLALESVIEPISMYEPVYNDGGDTVFIMDQLGEDNCEDNWISSIVFKDTMKKLSEREKKIMSLRFLSGKTQVEVAGEIGISQAQVSRLEKNAMKKIKKEL